MKNIKVIIPLHEFNDEVRPLLKRAIESIPEEYEIHISTTKEVSEVLSEEKFIDLKRTTILWTSKEDGSEVESSFCSLVNHAVEGVNSDYFSILEYDDEYTDIWFRNVEEYIGHMPEVSAFLPLNDLIDFNDNSYMGYGNEAPWASSFSNEIGYIDNDCLQQFFDFYLTGAVFNTQDWVNCGGLKNSMKVTFWYEFLLRLTNNSKLVYVIPKVGYKHYVNRPNSIFSNYRNTVDEKESNFWFETAKKEYLFKTDRNKVYEPNINLDNNEEEEE